MKNIILALALVLLPALILYFRKRNQTSKVDEKLLKLYQSVRDPIPQKKETAVPIEGLYVYPIRGIRSRESLDQIFLSAFGVMYDRELVLVDAETHKHVTTTNYMEMGCLN